jgi:hypothetical protein
MHYAKECLARGTLIGRRIEAGEATVGAFDAELQVRWYRMADAFEWLSELRRRDAARLLH